MQAGREWHGQEPGRPAGTVAGSGSGSGPKGVAARAEPSLQWIRAGEASLRARVPSPTSHVLHKACFYLYKITRRFPVSGIPEQTPELGVGAVAAHGAGHGHREHPSVCQLQQAEHHPWGTCASGERGLQPWEPCSHMGSLRCLWQTPGSGELLTVFLTEL